MKRTILTAFALLAAAVAVAESPLARAFPPSRRPMEPALLIKRLDSTRQAPPSALPNTDFEGLEPNGHPTGWQLSGYPEIRAEPDGPGTNHYARVSRYSYYGQVFSYPVPAWQTFTTVARVRAEFGAERPQFHWESTNGTTGEFRFLITPRDGGAPTAWGPMYGSFTRQAGDQTYGFLIDTQADVSWADFDDLLLVTEEVTNGGFEDDESGMDPRARWTLSGAAELTAEGALTGSQSLRLSDEDRAEKLVAYTPDVVRYFLTGRASGPFLLEENRLLSSGEPASTSFSAQVTPAPDQRFFVDPLPSDGEGQAAVVALVGTPAGPVLVDDVTRGWAYAWPPSFAPVANSPRPTVRLAAAWPGNFSGAEIAILDDEEVEQARLTDLQQDGSSVWVDYDGGALPAGVYTARFEMSGLDGAAIAPERTFTIDRGPAFPARLDNFPREGFVRMPWIWLYPFTEEGELTSVEQVEGLLLPAKEDGFNFLWIAAREDQYPLIKEAAAQVGLPYLVAPVDLWPSFRSVQGNSTWDPQIVLSQLNQFDLFLDSPLFAGIYLYDEPNVSGAAFTRRVMSASLEMQRDGEYPPGVVFLSPGATLQDADFPFFCTYSYPFTHSVVKPEETLLDEALMVEGHIAQATAQGRDYWLGTQGYAMHQFSDVMRPTECSAQLGMGLALGMRGYFTFLYTTTGPLAGLRTQQYGETARLEAYRDFNARTAAIESLLLSLPQERSTPPQSNVFARTCLDQEGNSYAFVVNHHVDDLLSLAITTDSVTRLVNVESGVKTAEGTVHEVVMAPGQWAVYTFEDGAAPTNFAGQLQSVRPVGAAPVTVLASFTTPEAPQSIALRPDGTAVASVEGNRHVVHSLMPGSEGTVLLNESNFAFNGYPRYQDNTRVSMGSRFLGPRVFEHDGGTLAPVYTLLRESGNGVDMLLEGGSAWISENYWGVSRVDLTGPSSFTRVAHFFSEDNDFRSLHGPFADGSIVAVEAVRGLYRLALNGATIESERLSASSEYEFASLSPGGRLAVGRLDRGAAVYDIGPDGRIAGTIMIDDPKLIDAGMTAWLSEDTVAVVDGRFGLRFYRLEEDGGWRSLGFWEPVAPPFQLECVSALPSSRLAVGLTPARIVVGDATGVINSGREEGWMLQ